MFTRPPITLITLLCLIFSGQILCQSQPRFTHLNSSHGLSQNSVNHIYQDRFGYLWFCTQDGLNRYNGYEFKVYRPDAKDPFSISDNFVFKIIPDTGDNFWVLCRYGLNYYDRTTDRFYKYFVSDPSDITSTLDVFEWGGDLYANIDTVCYRLPERSDGPYTMVTDTAFKNAPRYPWFAANYRQSLFAVSDDLILQFDEDGKTIFRQKQASAIGRIQGFKRSKDELFLLFGNVVYRLDTVVNRLDTFYSDQTLGEIQDVLKRQNGDYWIAHQFGVDVIKNGGAIERVRPDESNPNSLSYPLVHSLFEDKVGTIWIGTANGGLNYLPASVDKFKTYSIKDGLPAQQVWSVYQISEDKIWVGTENGLGLLGSSNITDQDRRIIDFVSGFRITAITADSEGNYWIGTSKNGVFYAAPSGVVKALPMGDERQNNKSISCFIEKGDSMWVGTFGNLHVFSLSGELLEEIDFPDTELEMPITYVLSLEADEESIFIGTAQGLNILNTDTRQISQFIYKANGRNDHPSFQFITRMFLDKDGMLWLSTFGGGLNRFDPTIKKFEVFDAERGLANDVLACLAGFENEIWVSHNNGLSRFDMTDSIFDNYGAADGLPFKEFALGAGHSYGDSMMHFGGTGGLVSINVNHFTKKPVTITPILSDYQINYGSIETPQTEFPESVSQLTILPNYNVVSFKFAVPEFLHATDFSYQYQLEGFDHGWVDAPIAERRATYSNLPAGDFIFRVRAFDQNLRPSPNELQIPISVIPPIWKRWWFVLIVGLALLFLLVFVVRYLARIKIKRQLRELEMKARVQRERERISMDLHDHVGAQITYLISNLDRLSLEEQQKDGSIRGLGKYAREAMRELRDTVWAIRKDSMPVGELKQRIEQFANPLFQGAKIRFSAGLVGSHEASLDPASALHTMRIVQEALHNAFKYAKASVVEVKLSVSKSELNVVVKDDGIGFAESEIQGNDHNGLRNMRERASEIGAVISVQSKKGGGTQISLVLGLENKANASLRSTFKNKSLAK